MTKLTHTLRVGRRHSLSIHNDINGRGSIVLAPFGIVPGVEGDRNTQVAARSFLPTAIQRKVRNEAEASAIRRAAKSAADPQLKISDKASDGFAGIKVVQNRIPLLLK